jgi:ABC-type iron transport system FetAB permease component
MQKYEKDEFWMYLICHVMLIVYRLVVVGAVLWLTYTMNNPWMLFGMFAAMVGYTHDYRRGDED